MIFFRISRTIPTLHSTNSTKHSTNMTQINTCTFPPGNAPKWVPKSLQFGPVTVYHARFYVRREDAGFIIGSKGFKVKRFSRDSGAQIVIKHTADPSSFFEVSALSGDSVQMALKMLADEGSKAFALNTGQKPKTQRVQHFEHTEQVNPKTAGLLIGRGGATCRGIKQHFKLVGFRVETKDDRSVVRISGEKYNVMAALEKLRIDFPTVFTTQSSPVVSGGGAAQTVQHAPGASPYYPPQNQMEKNMMMLYPTMFDGVARPQNQPRSPSYEPHTPPGTPPGTPPRTPRTPPETPRKISLEGVSEEQLYQECQFADRMVEFFTKNN